MVGKAVASYIIRLAALLRNTDLIKFNVNTVVTMYTENLSHHSVNASFPNTHLASSRRHRHASR